MIEPMSQQVLARIELIPQAVIQIPAGRSLPDFVFETGEDDLAAFRAAAFTLDDKLPFALFRYETAPRGEIEIRLPTTVKLDDVRQAIERIVVELEMPSIVVKWMRESADAPF